MNIHENAFFIILHSGNARSKTMQALQSAREQQFSEADNLLEEAEKEINVAHKVQTEMIQSNARGEEINLSILLIHAQDHLMTAMLAIDLAKEILLLHKDKVQK